MKAEPTLLLFSVVLAGVTAWTTTVLLRPSGEPPAVEALGDGSAAVRGVEDGPDAAAARLASLQQQVEELQARLAELERARRAAPVRGVVDAVTAADLEALEARLVRSFEQARPLVAASSEPEFRDRVAVAIDALQKQRVEEKVYARHEQLDQRIAGWTEALGLDGYQQEQVRTILATRDQREQELMRLWREGAEDEALGDAKSRMQQEFDGELERVLSADQLTRYRESQQGSPGKR
jgi:hypothetical protein